ncbi:MAG: LysM peptidoglycan-binding domain-containing protein [Puniceicoccales bacterium]|nr:LysM peptidoglycan-binding domain-containing protein [Puniceicoccales bacterium]
MRISGTGIFSSLLPRRSAWLPVLLVFCFLTACRPTAEEWSEEEDGLYRRGQQLLREGRATEALEKFLAVIRRHHPTPQSHLFCGKIYWETLEDPIFAIYHFRQFLIGAAEEAKEREWVPQWIDSLQKLFMKQCHQSSLYKKYAHDFPVLLRELRQENAQLKRRVIDLERQLEREPEVSVGGQRLERVLEERAQGRRKTYLVQEGDTLSIISQKVFGDASRWPAIFEANRDQLSQPDQVRVGQRLLLPSAE